MDVVQIFNDELQSLTDAKPPVSKAKMGLITRAAMKGVKFYKHIVQGVEKFIAKCRPEYKVPGLYVIDSIVRQSRHQFGIERDVYAARFARNLQITFNNLFSGCSSDDRSKIVRVLNLWQKNGVFNSQVIQPLLDMANPNSAHNLPIESALSTDSPNNLNMESSKQAQTSKYLMHHFSGSNNNLQHGKSSGSSSKHYKSEGDSGSRFSKSMLDFEYDEDDDDDGDETPTEAEPPLSSTLNKIEKEQRSRADIATSNQLPGQLQHQQPIASSQLNLMRNDQDPVLERWNKLMKQQSITNDGSRDSTVNENRYQRARSRSPPVREKVALISPVKEITQLQVKSPIENSAEWAAERKAERIRKCFPKIKDKHLTVCSSTLWLGHVPKTVSEADISDAFGEFGTITSIDLIPPRGCAYVCMDRRQDAKKALSESRDLKLNGSHIKMAWAPGKGFKEYKKLKDFWEVDIGSSYIPYAKIDSSIDFDVLEEGGVIDEDSMTMEMRELRERRAKEKEDRTKEVHTSLSVPLAALPILAKPPSFTIPPPNLSIPPPTALNQGSGMGGIPFPPPNVTSSSNQMPTQQAPNIFEHSIKNVPLDHDKNDSMNSPISLDQQLSMTERQINMVEQQLSMIQQVQSMGQPQPVLSSIHQQALFHHQSHTNQMLFEMPPPSMLHGGPPPTQLMDPQQIPIFANPPSLLGQPPPLLPINQHNMNSSMNGNSMQHYGPRY